MANKLLIPAVAGSGKTYYIANSIKEEKRNLIISFTNSNIKNIEKEIIKRFGEIPENTEIITFSSFVYRYLIRPYEPSLWPGGFTSRGVDIVVEPVENQGKGTKGYYKDDNPRHYINLKNKSYYSSRMSKFFNKRDLAFKKKVIKNLSKFFDYIYIDEIQDFRGNDFELLITIYSKFTNSIEGVGDFFQHSVQKSNPRDHKPFKKNKVDTTYDEYIKQFPKKVTIEKNRLIKSRRVPEVICKEIRNNLGIEIHSSSVVIGEFKIIQTKEELLSVMQRPNVVGLIYNNNVKNHFLKNQMNTWSKCKGDTYESVCVVLTEKVKNFGNPNFKSNGISQQTINKLYVALTRATESVYVVSKEIYDLLNTH